MMSRRPGHGQYSCAVGPGWDSCLTRFMLGLGEITALRWTYFPLPRSGVAFAAVFDSHCHLTDLPDADDALQEARAAGVTAVLTCGTDAKSNREVRALRARHPRLPFSLGLHPWNAADDVEEVLAQIRAEQPTAVGE